MVSSQRVFLSGESILSTEFCKSKATPTGATPSFCVGSYIVMYNVHVHVHTLGLLLLKVLCHYYKGDF